MTSHFRATMAKSTPHNQTLSTEAECMIAVIHYRVEPEDMVSEPESMVSEPESMTAFTGGSQWIFCQSQIL